MNGSVDGHLRIDLWNILMERMLNGDIVLDTCTYVLDTCTYVSYVFNVAVIKLFHPIVKSPL